MVSIMLPNDDVRGGYCMSQSLLPDSINARDCELMFDHDGLHVSTASQSIEDDASLMTQNPNNCREGFHQQQKLPSDFNGDRGLPTAAHKISSSAATKPDKELSTSAKTCCPYSDPPSSRGARRVIFPWLHSPSELPIVNEEEQAKAEEKEIGTPVLDRKDSAPTDSNQQQQKQIPQQLQLPSEILLLLTSPTPRLVHRIVHRTTPTSNEKKEQDMCRTSQPSSSRAKRLGIELESLQIPPFKGVVYPSESSTLSATCLRPSSMPFPDFLRTDKAKTQPAKPLRSILRSKSVDCKSLDVDFDLQRRLSMPPLVSLKDEEDDSQSSTGTDGPESVPECPGSDSCLSRSYSTSRVISFDPRVWVREFQRTEDEKRNTWYSPKDLERFKTFTLTRILEYRGSQLFATGTGRAVHQAPAPVSKAVYANPALTLESEADELKDEATPFQSAVVECEIRNILIVDPHDICLRLLEKSFQRIIPHANITTVRSGKEAMEQYHGSTLPFDVVMVEERLHFFQHQESTPASPGGEVRGPSSGSSLIRKIMAAPRGAFVIIGISANFGKDQAKLQESGADLVWSKPPPTMNSSVRETILKLILLKRGRRALASALFGES